MKKFIMGVDLGQLSDFTAISLSEEIYAVSHKKTLEDLTLGFQGEKVVERKYALRYLGRPPIRTPYTDIVEMVKNISEQPEVINNVEIIVDATGVGRPVVDMFRKEGLRIIPVTIVGGSTISLSDDGGYHVPKKDIAGALQSMFGRRKIVFAQRLNLVNEFLTEMEKFSIRRTERGNITYEAWRESDHDDLVLSVGIAIWYAGFTRAELIRHSFTKEEEDYSAFDYILPNKS